MYIYCCKNHLGNIMYVISNHKAQKISNNTNLDSEIFSYNTIFYVIVCQIFIERIKQC